MSDGSRAVHGGWRNLCSRRRFLSIVCAGVPSLSMAVLYGEEGNKTGLGLAILPKSEWSEAKPRLPRLNLASPFSRITIHHTGGEPCNETDKNAVIFRLSNIQAALIRRNYGDIGYHFVVDYAGRAWEGRSLAYEGAHVSSANVGNIGIMALGNFERQVPSKRQLETTRRLVDALRKRHGIAHARVYGHRDLGHSICPGRNLYSLVAEIRKANGSAHDSGTENRGTAG